MSNQVLFKVLNHCFVVILRYGYLISIMGVSFNRLGKWLFGHKNRIMLRLFLYNRLSHSMEYYYHQNPE